jgi:hypothetical protein
MLCQEYNKIIKSNIILILQFLYLWKLLYSYFICDLRTVKLSARSGRGSVLTVALGRRPRATVQNTIHDTDGQLFECSQITHEITVLLPDQLLF